MASYAEVFPSQVINTVPPIVPGWAYWMEVVSEPDKSKGHHGIWSDGFLPVLAYGTHTGGTVGCVLVNAVQRGPIWVKPFNRSSLRYLEKQEDCGLMCITHNQPQRGQCPLEEWKDMDYRRGESYPRFLNQ
jgi:hypothetical protein